MTLENIIEMDKNFYVNIFGDRIPLAFNKGRGCYLTSVEGDEYLDFYGGVAVNSLGHAHPKFVSALKEQLDSLIHTSSTYYVENQALLAQKLSEISGLSKVVFANSGAEANEAALKMARLYFYRYSEPRRKVVTLTNSFHGRTFGTLAASGQNKFHTPFRPILQEFHYINPNDDEMLEEIDDCTAAVMIELVQGECGVRDLDAGYVKRLVERAKAFDTLVIVDEVQTGIARTGAWFAYQQYGIKPDIVTVAKGLGGGVPIGAAMVTDSVARMIKPGDHGSTFAGSPFACRAGLEVIKIIEEENLIDNVNVMGDKIREMLNSLGYRNVRGKGLMIGVPVDNSPLVCQMLRDNHVIVGNVGLDTLRLLPPLIVGEAEVERLGEALKMLS
ncbi:MAG: acetylornithine/succinylornithine family transaminase [Clostridiales bacterium]|jgi:predicted acetylornithine/succinylornithine family transaminase|nr:acetylornithine/succinylornithine family transaminase [Clostridiales bacterium]